jgi:hypothetical protein
MEKTMIDLIGNTPLIKLKYPSEVTGCNIYGKAEFMNPGGSVKDRAAMGIILDAEKNKQEIKIVDKWAEKEILFFDPLTREVRGNNRLYEKGMEILLDD